MSEIEEADGALREAAALFVAGGDFEKVGKEQRARAASARARLDAVVDAVFFDNLWERVAALKEGTEQAKEKAREHFHDFLVKAARRELERAFESLPVSAILKHRARARARARLDSRFRKSGLLQSQPVGGTG